MTTRLEDELREVFAAKTSAPPALRAQLPVVAQRARTVRRRRRTIAVAGVAVVVMVAALALAGVQRGDRSAPPAKSPAPGLVAPVEMVRNGKLVTTDGRETPLDVAEVTWAIRVPNGVLYMTPANQLRLLPKDGTSIALGDDWMSVMVSRDGRRIAAHTQVGADQILAATVRPDGLDNKVTTPASEDTYVLGWLGDRLVLAEMSRLGVWDPAHPETAPQWTEAGQLNPLAATADLRHFWAVTPDPDDGDQRCLAQVDPAQRFKVLRETCDIGIPGSGRLALSPYGEYLAVLEDDGKLRVLRLDNVFDRPRWYDECPQSEGMAWIRPDALVSGQSICQMEWTGEMTVAELPPAYWYVPWVGV